MSLDAIQVSNPMREVVWRDAGTYQAKVCARAYVEVGIAGAGSAGLVPDQAGPSAAGESSSVGLETSAGEAHDMIEADGGQSVLRFDDQLDPMGQDGTRKVVRFVVKPGETLRATVGAGGQGTNPENSGQDGEVRITVLAADGSC